MLRLHGWQVWFELGRKSNLEAQRPPVLGAAVRRPRPPFLGDPAVLIAAAAKVRERLGWRPRITGLDDIVRAAWGSHQYGRPHGY
jgi:UDP-glucose 4-epimerase